MDVAPFVVRLGKHDVLLATCYLRPGGKLRGPQNAARLHGLFCLVSQLKIPWIAFGDWNATPEEFLESGWTACLQAGIVAPANTVATCRSGRLLDYVLCSEGARPLLGEVTLADAGWKSHVGLDIEINLKPVTIRCWRIILPALFKPRPTWKAPPDPFSKSQRLKVKRRAEVGEDTNGMDRELFHEGFAPETGAQRNQALNPKGLVAAAHWFQACMVADLPAQTRQAKPEWWKSANKLLQSESEALGEDTCSWLSRVERYYCRVQGDLPAY